MTDTDSLSRHTDTIDRVLGLAQGCAVHRVRHQRTKVVDATQASEDLLLGAPIDGLSVTERLLVALFACALTPAAALAAEYAERLDCLKVDPALVAAVASGRDDAVKDPRLLQMLKFTNALITEPIKADRQALLDLQAVGLTTPQITALAQLVAFVSYQVRVVAGLKAMRDEGAIT